MARTHSQMWPTHGSLMSLCVSLVVIGAATSSAIGQCGNIAAGSDSQIGIGGGILQECGDDQWTGLAFPINTPGGLVDTVTFQLNTNRAGGDVYITGDAGGCQPDVTNILAQMCCSLEGLPEVETVSLHFPAVNTDSKSPTWVLFVARTGRAGQDADGNFNGSPFPAYQMARACIPDGNGVCTADTGPGRAFANFVGTGNPGDWTDLDTFGGDPSLGTFYAVGLSMTGADPDEFDCSQFVGACCLFDGACLEDSHPFQCFVSEGSSYAGGGVSCADADCQACKFADKGGACGNPESGPCSIANGSPGCDDSLCCCLVCEEEPLCCTSEWDAACAAIAVALNCVPPPGQPSNLATGPDETVDGYLRIGTDDFGSWALPGFGGALGAYFNPVGDEPLATPDFAQHFSVYRQAAGEGESLTTNFELDDLCTNNNSMTRGITTLSVSTDTNNDTVNDTKVSTWELISQSGMDTSWVLTQHVFNATPKGGPLVAIVTFGFEITNNTGTPVDFILNRHLDIDSFMGPGGFGNDNVGTGTNGAPGLDRFVYQGELGHPEWTITLSSPTGAVYYGTKQTLNPQGDGCVDDVCVGGDNDGEACVDDDFCLGGCTEFSAGTTGIHCLNIGTPDCWKNFIPSVGYDTDGDSGGNPGGDASIGLEVPVSIPANDFVIVNVMLTYGADTPGGE